MVFLSVSSLRFFITPPVKETQFPLLMPQVRLSKTQIIHSVYVQ